ncbi:energy transducer TonB [Kordiimonas aestuarii]|uniref:energy transducer TonB n=1 Tax=Kordiimonas aestuarii TaxID=1005925 RepID=UPI0021D3E135|nr:energy transducer TonB [Kordiimonas aestuarii]
MNTTNMRAFPIVSGAAFTTFGLFLLMQGLITKDNISFPAERPVFNPNIILAVPDEPEIRPINRVAPPQEVKPVPVPPKPTVDLGDDKFIGLRLGPAPMPQTGAGDDGGFRPGYMDGERIPLVRVQPQYPRRALERGIEGSAVVEFTVREDGTVADARVIKAEPQGLFEHAALAAIAKFKYKPTVVGGIPRASNGIRYRFVFELTSDD